MAEVVEIREDVFRLYKLSSEGESACLKRFLASFL